jgi:flagellar biosynthesis anti-sigma factor FlgM
MIINPIGSTASEFVAEKNSKTSKDGIGAGVADKYGFHTTLSSDTSAVGSLVATSMQSPEVRQGKVDVLKASISSGAYQLDAGAIATGILNEHWV